MTFSIAASGPADPGGEPGTAYGVAVASKFIAVGAVVPAASAQVGAVATQSYAKWSYRADVLALLADGVSAPDAVARVTAADPGRATRQLGVAAADGSATFTGSECLDWAGGVAGGDPQDGFYAIQGNILTGPQVVEDMLSAWVAGRGMPLAERLLAALLAGDRAGGDRRGRQGAALYVVAENAGYDQCGVLADLRVDDHPQAVTELARLVRLNHLYTHGPEDVRPWTEPLAAEVRDRLAILGHRDPDLWAALQEWAGIENFEMRMTPEGIDALVLDQLRSATSDGSDHAPR